jgi:hypothetical protein
MKRCRFAKAMAMGWLFWGCNDASTTETTAGGMDGGVQLADAMVDAAPAYDSATTELTGTLGASGALRPIVSSLVISNSGETLVYMTTAPLTCDELKVSRWLGAFTQDAQVIEIVVSGPPKVGPGNRTEVNWATGGRSSAYEQGAATASVIFTKGEAMGVVEGTVTATYDKPTGHVSGHFHAEFCPNGQDY